MKHNELQFQKDFLDNLQLNIIDSAYTHCWDTWRNTDYTPEYNKFYLICEGEGWLKIGDAEFYPKPGQLFLMPAGVLQSYSTISSNTFKKYWCHFTARIGDANLFDMIQAPCFIDVCDYEKIKDLFERLVHEQEDSSLYARLKEKALLTEITAYYLEKSNARGFVFSGLSAMDKLNSAVKYVQEHVSESITVDDIANKLHFQSSYFSRMFKKYFGVSPSQYILKVKLEKAKVLLKSTELNISEIASQTGFCDIYHFSKTFKNHTGFSPRDYRII